MNALRPFSRTTGLSEDFSVSACVYVQTNNICFEFKCCGTGAKPSGSDASVWTESDRKDGLWRSTCYEAFLAWPGEESYWEFNFSPFDGTSAGWNIYRFDGYRAGMRPEHSASRVSRTSPTDMTHRFVVEAHGELAARLTSPAKASLAAVVEAHAGAVSYWALAHASKKPDFHQRATFVAEVRSR